MTYSFDYLEPILPLPQLTVQHWRFKRTWLYIYHIVSFYVVEMQGCRIGSMLYSTFCLCLAPIHFKAPCLSKNTFVCSLVSYLSV
jgi:hypothetical protein